MTKIFISYARDGGYGENLSIELQSFLNNSNYKVFRDVEGLKPGDIWYKKIETELKASDLMVLVLSEKVSSSKWVHNEFNMAEELGIRVIPLLAEKGFFTPVWVRHLQIMDFSISKDWNKLKEYIESYGNEEILSAVVTNTYAKIQPSATNEHDCKILNIISEIFSYDLIVQIKEELFGSIVPRVIINSIDEYIYKSDDPLFSFNSIKLEKLRNEATDRGRALIRHFSQQCVGHDNDYYKYIDLNEFKKRSANFDADYWKQYSVDTQSLAYKFCETILALRKELKHC